MGFFKKKVKKPNKSATIDIRLIDDNVRTIQKLYKKEPKGNSNLIFEENKVSHSKYGFIGYIPDKKLIRLNKLEKYTYYWEAVFYETDILDSDGGMTGRTNGRFLFSLKIYKGK